MKTLIGLIILFIFNSGLLAQERVLGFEIYTIEATGARQSTANVVLSSALMPYKDKLIEFPFDKFQLIHSSNLQLPVMKREEVLLDSDQKIIMRPFYCESGRIGLWLEWLDQNSEELLNTRLHFNQSDPVVVGAEQSEYSARLLLVKLVSQ